MCEYVMDMDSAGLIYSCVHVKMQIDWTWYGSDTWATLNEMEE